MINVGGKKIKYRKYEKGILENLICYWVLKISRTGNLRMRFHQCILSHIGYTLS